MKKYVFYDIELLKELVIESETISGAVMKSLEMVMDGEAKHPVFVCAL